MKYFERNRRRLTKHHYMRGTQKSISGTSSVLIEDSAGVPLKRIEISGKTIQALIPLEYQQVQYIEMSTGDGAWLNTPLLINSNLKLHFVIDKLVGVNANGSSVLNFTSVDSLLTLNINGTAVIADIPRNSNSGYVIDVDLSNAKITIDGVDYDVSSHLPLSDETTTFGIGRTSTGSYTTHGAQRVSAFKGSDGVKECELIPCKDIVSSTPGFYNLESNVFYASSGSYNFTSGSAVTLTPNTPIPIQNSNDNGIIVSLNGEEIEIPTSIDVNGTKVPLLFSEYDKLIVDGENKMVYYESYAFPYIYTGDEWYGISSWAGNLGYGNYYQTIPKNNVAFTDVLLSSHFKKGKWTQDNIMKTQTNVVTYTSTWYLVFKTDGTQTIDDFKAWVKEQYEAGTPVTVIAKRKYAKTYDLTHLDFGQKLLALCVPKGESGTLEVSSELGITSLDVSYYSEVNEDKVTLSIRYVNEAGEEIAEPKTYNVRRGSKYQIVVPHIDGYTRTQERVFGVASGDEQINLIYKEAEDAGI